jgi:hypothetical protein
MSQPPAPKPILTTSGYTLPRKAAASRSRTASSTPSQTVSLRSPASPISVVPGRKIRPRISQPGRGGIRDCVLPRKRGRAYPSRRARAPTARRAFRTLTHHSALPRRRQAFPPCPSRWPKAARASSFPAAPPAGSDASRTPLVRLYLTPNASLGLWFIGDSEDAADLTSQGLRQSRAQARCADARFPGPLIELDVRISRIQLSDHLQPAACAASRAEGSLALPS